MGADSATPVGPASPADSAAARDLADAPSAGAGMGRATARVRDAAGKELGVVTLTEGAQGIAVAGTLRGLPAGEHAMHLHTTGKCEPPFESAGPHWNPTQMQHGSQAPGGPHMGDLPNVTVAADGSVALQGTTPGGQLRGPNGLIDTDGAALMIHGKADDYKSQPGGDAGPRVACGVVEMGS
jgi:Cu-Zn family superoxide dismutase